MQSQIESELINEYQTSPITIRQLVVKYGIPYTSIRRIFTKNNIKRYADGIWNRKYQDLVGIRVGRLLVIEQGPKCEKYKKRQWRCLCDCGVEKLMDTHALTCGKVVSCGCFNSESKWRGFGEVSSTYFHKLKDGAIRRKIKFEITLEDIWNQYLKQNRKCYYSNRYVEFNRKGFGATQTASVDRIDSNKGYTKDNIQIVHKDVNKMKFTLSDADFIALCHAISDFTRKKENQNEKVAKKAQSVGK